MPRTLRSRIHDPAQSAAVTIAMTAATDEEFARGLPMTNPGAILPTKKYPTTPDEVYASIRTGKKKTAGKISTSKASKAQKKGPIIDREKLKAGMKKLAERKGQKPRESLKVKR